MLGLNRIFSAEKAIINAKKSARLELFNWLKKLDRENKFADNPFMKYL